jgi:DNA-binding XRE family transcriptional regulator
MIRNEIEYQASIRRIAETEAQLVAEEERLEKAGRTAVEIKRLLEDVRTLVAGLYDDREMYERLRRSDYSDLAHLDGIGPRLVALRIAHGMTEHELAEKLGVDEAAIARDERNEYQGITVERATRILGAMGLEPDLLEPL